MRNFCILILFLTIAPMLWFTSCVEQEPDDNKPPTMADLRFNKEDTINYKGNIVRINKDSCDTLVIGRPVYFSGRFMDNVDNGLSSYVVKLDSIVRSNASGDSISFFTTKIGANIFGKKDTTINRHMAFYIPDSMNIGGKWKSIHEGLYKMTVKCGDKAGNRDSTIFNVMVLRRKTIYDHRTK